MKRYLTVLIAAFLIFSTRLFAQQDTTGKFFKSFDGTHIYYQVKGSGYPVVLVHGYANSSSNWKKAAVYSDLLKSGYQVIILDQRGNGKSDKPHTDAAYINDAEARDIMGLVSLLKIKKYNVVGYSRGSIITSRLIVLDKRLSKAVIGGMGDGYTDPEWPRRLRIYHRLSGDTSLHDMDAMVNYFNSQHYDMESLALQQKHQPSTSRAELAAVKIPVLIIRGTEDKENGSETALRDMIPGAKLVYVPQDHNNAYKNEQFGEEVVNFFNAAH